MKSITPRRLDTAEEAVIRNALVKAPRGDVPVNMIQDVSSLVVVGICECGCHSLYFQDIASGDYIVADGVGYLANNEGINVMIWARGTQVTTLELVDHYGSGQLPLPESVCSWEEAGAREAKA